MRSQGKKPMVRGRMLRDSSTRLPVGEETLATPVSRTTAARARGERDNPIKEEINGRTRRELNGRFRRAGATMLRTRDIRGLARSQGSSPTGGGVRPSRRGKGTSNIPSRGGSRAANPRPTVVYTCCSGYLTLKGLPHSGCIWEREITLGRRKF